MDKCERCRGEKVVVNLLGTELHETCPVCKGTGLAAPSDLDGARRVVVDYGRSLGEAIAAGGYDCANADITEDNFPAERGGRADVGLELVHLDRIATTAKVEAELSRRGGLRPAAHMELLAFGERYPDVQRKFPVVALGSSWADPDGSLRVPCLDGDSGRRRLRLYWGHPGRSWYESCRFLAVRK